EGRRVDRRVLGHVAGGPSELRTRALAKRIQNGNSFSGNEPNCFFLNTGEGRFADVAAAVGLDQSEDGRALAATDWDQDGDVDLWLTNRNGPRLRFLQNHLDESARNASLSLKLEGNPSLRCNRDAIGARVQVKIAGRSETYSRTLHAGDGFLSQSSKILHFGLPAEASIASVIVRWPHGQSETFAGIQTGGRYLLRQGGGTGQPLPHRPKVALASTDHGSDATSDRHRLLLTEPRPLSSMSYTNPQGESEKVLSPGGKAVLLTLWSNACRSCLEELERLVARKSEITGKGLTIVALSTDLLIDGSQKEAVLQRLHSLGFNHRAGFATEALVEQLDETHRRSVYPQSQLPVPVSFLIDPTRKLTAVYQGPIDLEQVYTDIRTFGADSRSLHRSAVPFPGRWAIDLLPTNPVAAARVFLEGHYFEDAEKHLNDYLEEHGAIQGGVEGQRLADIHYMIGETQRRRKGSEEAIASLREAMRLNPYHTKAWKALVASLTAQKKPGEVRTVLKELAGKTPAVPEAASDYGQFLLRMNETAAGLQWLEKAYQQKPKAGMALNTLIRIYATHPRAEIRNGKRALELSQALLKADSRNPMALDTAAAAFAETGQFDKAVQLIQQAIQMAKKDPRLTKGLQTRGKLYQAGKPFRTRS
ncbi:MAG: ASPIC/UnbV domain-containing protein, partial [Verrucomicrobiota bacterium]